MARFRSNLRPIQSDKHETTWSNLVQNASTQVSITLAQAVQPSATNTGTEVEVGSTIKSFFLEFHFSAENVANPKVIHWQMFKRPFGSAGPSPATYYQVQRRFIFKRGMEMLPKSTSTVFKRIIVVKVPRGKQRMGESDLWQFQYICSSSEAINACGICIYKAYK